MDPKAPYNGIFVHPAPLRNLVFRLVSSQFVHEMLIYFKVFWQPTPGYIFPHTINAHLGDIKEEAGHDSS
jgi:hypothetical protein